MNHLSLFSGVGMLDLAMEREGFRTIATAEIEPFCRKVLQARFPDALHYSDVKLVKRNDEWECAVGPSTQVDLLSGGFPCQDLSLMGNGAGLAGERSGLWREFRRIIEEFTPAQVFIENVTALRTRGLNALLNDLHYVGYDARWDCFPAAAVGAPHMRDRLWIVATRRTEEAAPIPASKIVGYVGPEGDGVLDLHDKAEPVTRLPRAGAQVNGVVVEQDPAAPTASCRRYAVLPTPTRSDGTGGPGTTPKREGGKNLRTAAAERGSGPLSPAYVEWMMGLPLGWTDPSADLQPHPGWDSDPPPITVIPRSVPNRSRRMCALGNGLVPKVAQLAWKELTK